jgi:hypothetical protein
VPRSKPVTTSAEALEGLLASGARPDRLGRFLLDQLQPWAAHGRRTDARFARAVSDRLAALSAGPGDRDTLLRDLDVLLLAIDRHWRELAQFPPGGLELYVELVRSAQAKPPAAAAEDLHELAVALSRAWGGPTPDECPRPALNPTVDELTAPHASSADRERAARELTQSVDRYWQARRRDAEHRGQLVTLALKECRRTRVGGRPRAGSPVAGGLRS